MDLPIMRKQGRGRVINLIGNDAVKPSYWEIAPGAANAAGQNLTLAPAAQYGKDNISFVRSTPGRSGPSAGPASLTRWPAI
jgi:3-oxoacyl-[acyl-carrier protein] reductase